MYLEEELDELGIKEEPEEVLKPEGAYKVEVSMATLAQASETTSAA